MNSRVNATLTRGLLSHNPPRPRHGDVTPPPQMWSTAETIASLQT